VTGSRCARRKRLVAGEAGNERGEVGLPLEPRPDLATLVAGLARNDNTLAPRAA